MLRFVLILFFFVVQPSVATGDSNTAGTLGQWCREGNSLCSAFVAGFVTGYEMVEEAGKLGWSSPYVFCIPDGVTYGQMQRIYLQYINKHPEEEHESSHLVLARALASVFPCTKKELNELETQAKQYFCPSLNDCIGRREIQRAQMALSILDYDPGSVDGVLGNKTKDAIRRFQADTLGLEPTGELNFLTLAFLHVRTENSIGFAEP